MLSERREKQKWSVDPNGTQWLQDSNKFGTKMLEKMGWTRGKGLGANEDGSTEHIKVKKKNDLRGVGCSMKEANNWVSHQDDFSSLLAELNGHHSEAKDCKIREEKCVSNLEKHSKSQKRVHYHKFARGKNLSNYGDHDLAAIFGKRSALSAPSTPVNLSEDESSGADSTSSCTVKKKKRNISEVNSAESKEQINQVTSSMSVQEYFARRMAAIKERGQPSSSLQGSSDRTSCDPEFQQKEDKDNITFSQTGCDDSGLSLTKKKKKRKRTKIDTPNVEERTASLGSNSDEPISGQQLGKKKKAKSKKQKEDFESHSKSIAVKKKKSSRRKQKMSGESTNSPDVER